MTTYSPVDPYATAVYASSFVDAEYPGLKTAWDALGSTVQATYLRRASDIIDALPLVGWRTVETQSRAFPRGGDANTPDDVKIACTLIALVQWARESGQSTVDGLLNNDGRLVISETMGDVSFTYQGGSAELWRQQGIPFEALRFLSPYLRDGRSMAFYRC